MAITPILFPYTSVSSDLRNVALQFFPSLTLIQPMESALGGDADSDSGADIIVHVPAKDRQPELESLIKAYHLWAQQHPSTDLSAWAGRKEAVPFFDETAVARIQSQIRRGDLKQAASDPLFDCRLFLGIAQEFDRQMAESARSLETFRKAEVRMMRELKGEMETAPAKAGDSVPLTTSLAYMIPRRLKAWAALYLRAPLRDGIFITSGPDVIDHITTIGVPGRIHRIGTLVPPKSRNILIQRLESAVNAPWPHGGQDPPITGDKSPLNQQDLRLAVYMVPDVSPEHFFATFAPTGINPPSAQGQLRHTLIAMPAS